MKARRYDIKMRVFFNLRSMNGVPTAQHPINPVPNAVLCGVQGICPHTEDVPTAQHPGNPARAQRSAGATSRMTGHACRRYATDVRPVACLQHAPTSDATPSPRTAELCRVTITACVPHANHNNGRNITINQNRKRQF